MSYKEIKGFDHGYLDGAAAGRVVPYSSWTGETLLLGSRFKTQGSCVRTTGYWISTPLTITLASNTAGIKFGGNFYRPEVVMATTGAWPGSPSMGWSFSTGQFRTGGYPNLIGSFALPRLMPINAWASVMIHYTPDLMEWYTNGELMYSWPNPHSGNIWGSPSYESRKATGVYLQVFAMDDLWVIDDPGNEILPVKGGIVKTMRPSSSILEQYEITGIGTTDQVLAGSNIDDVNYIWTNDPDKIARVTVSDPFSDPPFVKVATVKQSAHSGKTAGGAESYRLETKVNSVVYQSSSFLPASSAYEQAKILYDSNPSTSIAWTPSEPVAAEWGVKSE